MQFCTSPSKKSPKKSNQKRVKCCINYFLEYRDLTKVIVARLLINFTYVLERTFFWNKPFRVFTKFLFKNIQEKIFRKSNVVAPNLNNISGRKCL